MIEQTLLPIMQNWYIATGYVGIILAMAIESCCIPLPSEIVMPLAGYIAFMGARDPQHFTTTTGTLSLVGVTIAGAFGCLLGSSVAYWIGASGGRPLLLKYGRYILISQADSDRADRLFARHGAPVAFFSRLLPVVRTFISLPAGIARMNFTKFMIYTFLGSLPWTFLLAYIGYAFGAAFLTKLAELSRVFQGLDIVIVVLFVAAVAFYVYRHIKHDREARNRANNAANRYNSFQQPRMPAGR